MNTLTREEKLELIKLLEEKKRREKDRRPLFKDRASVEQIEILKCEKRERFVFAGNGFGKTALGAEDVRCQIIGKNPYNGIQYQSGARCYIILDKPEKIDSVIIPALRTWMNIKASQLHKRGKPYIAEITFPEHNNAWIKFLFWDQSPLTAEGIEADYFWFDEPPPRELYISLIRGGRTRGRTQRYLVTGTPLAAPWLRTDVYEPWTKGERPDVECFRGHTESNRHNLADGYIEKFAAVLSDKEKGIRLRGEFFDLDGLALSHLFKRYTHTIKRSELNWDRNNPTVLVIDCHPSKPHYAVVMGVDKENRLYVLEEYKEKAVARKFAKSLVGLGWFSQYRFIDILYDNLGNSETTSGEGFRPFGEVINEVFAQHNLGRARATSYDEKNDEEFISRIQDCLLLPDAVDSFGQLVPKLRIVADCVGSIGDIENVAWAKHARSDTLKPHLDITHKDYLSCIKYGLAANLHYSKKKDRVFYRNDKPYGFKAAPGRNDIIRLARPRNR